MRLVSFLVIAFIASFGFSQDMKTGFQFLEQGNYIKARDFFEEVLQEYPDNKTARLCYGRALGLSGKTVEAKSLFIELQKDYPTDFEVALNYAESLLWNKDFTEAESVYEDLVRQDSTSFPAILGYANTLSNLKKYDNALIYVNNALDLQPENQNAAISKKYMQLGKASQQITNEQVDDAIITLESNLKLFPKDADTQNALANAYIAQKNYDQAATTYGLMADSLSLLTGQSLVAHLLKKDKLALQYAVEGSAFAKAKFQQDSVQHKETLLAANERYIQALIWNNKYPEAREVIATTEAACGVSNRLDALKATLGMYTGTFAKSISYYRAILEKDSTSFDGNLGIANAYRAQGNLDLARDYALKTLDFYPNQPDARALLAALKNGLAPVVNTVGSYTSDNGNNEAYAAGINAVIPFSDRFRSVFNYSYRTTENTGNGSMAYNTNASVGAHYRVHNNTWVESTLGFVKANADQNDYTDVNGSVFVKSRPWALQYLEVGYSRELQNFNADLIDEKIFMNNYSLNYNMGTNINLGWYTGLMHTQQTDSNSRNLLFTSLYYTFTKSPALKGGVNYQYLSYKDQVPTLYFSPSKYQAVEVFADLSGTNGNWTYSANAAGGYQFIEDQKATTLYRLEGNLSYAISERFQAGAYGKYSNTASATAAGFEFMELGVKLRWQILEGPLFQF
ncbi:tetratricopeptide repeat protein [Nonlabens agnitus]|uniref:Uncharacterized protein n=1 Tax=Nonlabens agnitus TaxID=870484 RepID=A0A2S9WRU5_9FLAO|nr:tetratricopeptide repeat protein [Nonlabens agnitus]PRP66224.1 hypothetical protein BST86_03525 [Nonlabens agnitus]